MMQQHVFLVFVMLIRGTFLTNTVSLGGILPLQSNLGQIGRLSAFLFLGGPFVPLFAGDEVF